MKNKKTVVIILAIIFLMIIIFLIKNNYKFLKKGNNISNKSADEIKEYILNISSYEAEVEINVISNKNQNKYKAKQQFVKEDNLYKQEIIEPENIKGVIFSYDGKNLKLENTKLGLNKIYEDYKYIGSNDLSLIQFVNDYNDVEEKSFQEKDGNVILELKIKNGNKYRTYKKLYVDKQRGVPTKMEIQDVSQNIIIYILYNEIKINNLQKEDILAFKLSIENQDI